MKIHRKKSTAMMPRNSGNRNGSVVFIFLTLLAIMMILFAANSRALLDLRQQTKLLERRQIERLDASQANVTNSVILPAKSESK